MTVITLKTSNGEKPFYAHADVMGLRWGTNQCTEQRAKDWMAHKEEIATVRIKYLEAEIK